MIEPVQITQASRVRCRKQPKKGMRIKHPVLIQERKLALALQYALDDKHYIRPTCVIFVEHQGHRTLQRPGNDTFLKLCHLQAVSQHDSVLSDQVQAADVAVQIHTNTWPIQARSD